MARGVRIRVSGVAAVVSTLTRFGQKTGDLKRAFEKISARIKQDAIPLTPHATGRLAASIRQGKGKNRATVRAGGNSRMSHGGGVYAPIAHYGTYTHESKGRRPFLTTALNMNRGYAKDQIEDEINSIISNMGLNR